MKWGFVEKIGSVGAFLAALACHACFPMLATVGAALGLGVLLPFEGIVFNAFRILVLVALVGNLLAYWKHKSLIPLLVGVASPVAVLLTPKPGDCCVFCSYGSVPCPPRQDAGGKHGNG